MRITSAGNIGIGTASPTTKLHIVTSGLGEELVLLNPSLGTNNLSIGVGQAISQGNIGFLGWQQTGTNTGHLFIESYGGAHDVVINKTGAGKVGIGTSTPSEKLDVVGNIKIGGSNNELRFYEGTNYVGFEAPALTGDQIWVLPSADGTSGQFLQTNGSGTLT